LAHARARRGGGHAPGVVPVRIDGQVYAVRVSVREHADGRHRFYTLAGFDLW